ncbi:MAG: TIM barrel protein [Chloroflexi bacterium]|jgi:mannonate dehydratase|nr:TIM barrel protein [Chloroflexota bacterium]
MNLDNTENRLKISLAISPDATPEELLFAQQLGVDCVYTWVRDDQRNLAYLKDLRQRVEDQGLILWNVGNISVAKSDKIHLALPGRDQVIADFQAFVEALGEAGIPITTFTWEPTQVWSSEPGEIRGARTRRVDLEEMVRRPYTHGRVYTEDELWDNFAYFMERIIPVAEGAGVRLALHPCDPPTDALLGGIPCLIHNAATYRKAFAIANSPALGMEFCVGCWLEGGDQGFGNVLDGIREFQAEGRILLVHFRNVSSPLPYFLETFLDNGYMDMYEVMKTLVDSGYTNTVTLDHTPQFVGDYAKGAGPGYAVGYMKALLRCAQR